MVKKARRFNAGNGEAPQLSPEGTAGPKLMMSLVGRPFGTGPFPTAFPGVETPGYSHLSLRDSIFAIFKTGSGRGGYQISHREKVDFSGFRARERMN